MLYVTLIQTVDQLNSVTPLEVGLQETLAHAWLQKVEITGNGQRRSRARSQPRRN